MSYIFQIAGLGVIAALACCIIREHTESAAAALSLTAAVLIFLAALQFLSPVIEILERLQTMTGLSRATVEPMLKVTGIGLLTQICSAVCEDAGEKTLHNAVQIAGTFMALYVSAPLISTILDLLEAMLNK